jgi:hypothetical protein
MKWKPFWSACEFHIVRKSWCLVQVSGFFVGVSAPLIGGAFECGVNYLTYTSALNALAIHSAPANFSFLSEQHTTTRSPAQPELRTHEASNSPCDDAPLAHVAAAAAVAGVALSFILSPVELVKCRLQVRQISKQCKV